MFDGDVAEELLDVLHVNPEFRDSNGKTAMHLLGDFI
jgi:hypothetical protein